MLKIVNLDGWMFTEDVLLEILEDHGEDGEWELIEKHFSGDNCLNGAGTGIYLIPVWGCYLDGYEIEWHYDC